MGSNTPSDDAKKKEKDKIRLILQEVEAWTSVRPADSPLLASNPEQPTNQSRKATSLW